MRHVSTARLVACLVIVLAIVAAAAVPTSAQRKRTARRAPARRAAAAAEPAPPRVALSTIIATSCAGCHNDRAKSPVGAVLQSFDATQIAADPGRWAAAYRHLQAGTMPPVGAPRPDRPTYDAAVAAIELALGANTPPVTRVTSQQAATRLATLLWSSTPDAALQQDADRGRLTDATVLAAHVRRMLADDRAEAFVQRFLVAWLGLDKLDAADPDRTAFPTYDVALRDGFSRETALFLLSQLREDRDPVDMWSADYTFVNERVANHYGIAAVNGPEFRRVSSTPQRAGLLGQGSVLMATSRHEHGVDAAYTTPATRAKWVLTHYFGVPTPSPFPGAQPVKPELPITPQTRTLPAAPCVNCHRNFFPLGYALEGFDSIGRARTHDQAGPVDVSGAFVDGTPTNGVVAMRQVLLQRPDAFRTTITEGLLVYLSEGSVSLRRVTPATLVQARQILRGPATPRWSAVIAAAVLTAPDAR
jgi:hypothetical protein